MNYDQIPVVISYTLNYLAIFGFVLLWYVVREISCLRIAMALGFCALGLGF